MIVVPFRLLWLAVFLVAGLLLPTGLLAADGDSTRSSATNSPLVVAVKASPPFTMKNSSGKWTGLSIDLWETLAEDLGLSYEYREFDLAGLLDEVSAGAADIGLAALTITPDREERMDFSHAYYQGGLGIAMGRNAESFVLSIVRNVFSAQFLSAVLALVGVLLVAAAAVWFFERKANPEQFGGTTAEGLGAGFWWSAVTMTTVGYGDKSPQSLGGRVVAVVWMFTSVIIISSFTAGIASSVTVNRISTDLLKSRPLHEQTIATVAKSTGNEYALKNGFRTVTYETLDDALAAVQDGRAEVILYDLPILKYRLLQDPAVKLDVLPQILVPEEYAVALKPNSPLREELNVAVLETTRTPEWQELKQRYLGAE